MPGLKFWVEVSVLCRNQYHKGPKVKESNDELWGVKKVEIKKKSRNLLAMWSIHWRVVVGELKR